MISRLSYNQIPAVNFTSSYVLVNGKPVGRLDNPSDSAVYYLADHLDSTSVILDSWANIVSKSDYYPYGGEIPVTTGSTGTKVFCPLHGKCGGFNRNRHPGSTHPGPEAWCLVNGAQCLRTPSKTFVIHAGETGFGPGDEPMVLKPDGAEARRSLFLVLPMLLCRGEPKLTRGSLRPNAHNLPPAFRVRGSEQLPFSRKVRKSSVEVDQFFPNKKLSVLRNALDGLSANV